MIIIIIIIIILIGPKALKATDERCCAPARPESRRSARGETTPRVRRHRCSLAPGALFGELGRGGGLCGSKTPKP